MNDVLMEKTIAAEWKQFQKVNNEGGRAWCQDNWQQFYIMRKSQFMCWSQEILASYYDDLLTAEKDNRNLPFEKYAWMMESTAPEQFAGLRHALPAVSEERLQRVNRAAAIQAKWGEDFARENPQMASYGRAIYTSEDTPGTTSIETYSRGELLSYSEKTEQMVTGFIFANEAKGVNLAKLIRDNMLKLFKNSPA